jgi:hypothetical protein
MLSTHIKLYIKKALDKVFSMESIKYSFPLLNTKLDIYFFIWIQFCVLNSGSYLKKEKKEKKEKLKSLEKNCA